MIGVVGGVRGVASMVLYEWSVEKLSAGRSLVSDSDVGRNISRVAGVKSAPYLTPHLVALISVLRVS